MTKCQETLGRIRKVSDKKDNFAVFFFSGTPHFSPPSGKIIIKLQPE